MNEKEIQEKTIELVMILHADISKFFQKNNIGVEDAFRIFGTVLSAICAKVVYSLYKKDKKNEMHKYIDAICVTSKDQLELFMKSDKKDSH